MLWGYKHLSYFLRGHIVFGGMPMAISNLDLSQLDRTLMTEEQKSLLNIRNISQKEIEQLLIMRGQVQEFQMMMMKYDCALSEVRTKLEVLNKELALRYNRNPFESIKSRVKTPVSIYEKLKRKGIPFSLDNIENNISDIAGCRAICSFVDDIYMLADCLKNQDDVTLTFYYDFNKSKREGKVFEIGNNDWSPYVVYTAKVDQSMADYHGLTSMQGMFSSLYDVTEIEGIEYLNTENVTDMSNMFCDCNSLTSVNLSHFNTSKVTTMAYMFDSCESLTTLNVSGFDMSNVMDVEAMFRYCSNLTTIYCNDNWAKQGLSDAEMFLGCVNLEGAVHFLEGNDYSDWANPTYGYFTWKKLRGDVNGDNKVDVADVTAMVNLIKSGAFSSAADLDGSGTLTAIDMTELVNIILGK